MRWGEALRLVERLCVDPSSHVAASVGGLEYPVPREAVVLMDLFDLQHASKSKRKPTPYPRPWSLKNKRRIGTARMTPEQLDAALARHRTEEPDA